MRPPRGLSAAQLPAYAEALASTHNLHVQVELLDLSENLLHRLHPRVNSGQVNCSADDDVTRSATIEFFDPTQSISFDSDSPSDSAFYFDRMIKIRYGVPVDGEVHWSSVFTGPMIKGDRTADVFSVEAQGKESRAMHGVPTMTLKRGHNAVDAIHDFLYERTGERRFAFPSLPNRLARPAVVSWEDDKTPWVVCKKIAASLDLQLFYDGDGVCRLRREPSSSQFRFHTGELGNITSQVQVSHELASIHNRVRVVGSNKHHVYETGLDYTHPGHPASPSKLGRNGVDFYVRQEIVNRHLRSKAAAKAAALKNMERAAKLQYTNTFNALPVPHLDELDMVRIHTPEYVGTERLRQWSFPLTGGDMTVGYNDLVSLPRRKNRR
jgi:hypothetical protein